MDEAEILRGAKVRVTTHYVTVGATVTPIDAISEAAFVQADRRIRFLPAFVMMFGPTAALALGLTTGDTFRPLAVALVIMAIGGVLWRDSWLHQVNARLTDGRSKTLYRTSKQGDAMMFQAAILKAKELRSEAAAFSET